MAEKDAMKTVTFSVDAFFTSRWDDVVMLPCTYELKVKSVTCIYLKEHLGSHLKQNKTNKLKTANDRKEDNFFLTELCEHVHVLSATLRLWWFVFAHV